MSRRKRKTGWAAVNRFHSHKNLRGCWLKDPDGKTVATILGHALANQIVAAMNLTTYGQRIAYCAKQAGYTNDDQVQ